MNKALLNLLEYKVWGDQELMAFLCENAARLDADLLRKTVRMMNHIHVVDCIFAAHLSGQSHAFTGTNTPDTPSPEALSWNMAQTHQHLLDLAKGTQAEGMDKRLYFTFTDGDGGGMSPAEMLMHVCVHSTYHRGQVGQMLKDADLSPPRELLTRKLHTQEPQRRHPTP
jgi:uncharacterized damage-inducible protein DinB